MSRVAAALSLILLLSACGALLASPPPDGPWPPMSRLTVRNQQAAAVYLRATWFDGIEQVSVIPVGDPLYISGSIAGAFPATIEILDAGCRAIIGRLTNQPPDRQALITVSATGLKSDPITTSEGRWRIAGLVDDCRTRPDPP